MSQNTCRDGSKHGAGAAGAQQQGLVGEVNPKRNQKYTYDHENFDSKEYDYVQALNG